VAPAHGGSAPAPAGTGPGGASRQDPPLFAAQGGRASHLAKQAIAATLLGQVAAQAPHNAAAAALEVRHSLPSPTALPPSLTVTPLLPCHRGAQGDVQLALPRPTVNVTYAAACYERAAAAGSAHGTERLAVMLIRGAGGLPQDHARAEQVPCPSPSSLLAAVPHV